MRQKVLCKFYPFDKMDILHILDIFPFLSPHPQVLKLCIRLLRQLVSRAPHAACHNLDLNIKTLIFGWINYSALWRNLVTGCAEEPSSVNLLNTRIAQAFDSIAGRTNWRNNSISVFWVFLAPILPIYWFLLTTSYLLEDRIKTVISLMQKRKGKIKSLQTLSTDALRYSQSRTEISEDYSKATLDFTVQTWHQQHNDYIAQITRLP